MFKDYDKYLSASLKVYLFVLVVIFIMKIVGLDYFGLDMDNPILLKINSFCLNFHLDYLYYFITLNIYIYIMIYCSTYKNKNLKIFSFVISIISFISLMTIKRNMNNFEIFIFDTIFYYVSCIIYGKNFKKVTKNHIFYMIVNVLFQIISLFIRSVTVKDMYIDNFLLWTLMNFDYLILTIIYYKLVKMKGEDKKWVEVYGYSLKKLNLKKLLKKLQENYHNFKNQDKENKIAIIIYFILSLIWNIFSVVVVLLIAKLNQTFIECIFILTSFWLSKRIFGKAFHLSSMLHCFIVSNLTYYCLNRITTPLGISILIPIMLGVGLSYVTSKLVKKTYKPLYKGMPEELFEETILKVTDKNSTKYKVCYDFYILKESEVSLSFKYNYSIAGIRKIKDRINAKIKELK